MSVYKQTWLLVNVDKKQISNYYGLHHLNWIGARGHDEQPCRSISLPCLSPQVDVWCNPTTTVVQTSPLFAQPAELLDMIFSALEELHHAISFAVTCRYLLSAGRPHILRLEREFYSPWAGCRLICIGSQTDENDLPMNMLTSQEKKEVVAWSRAREAWESADGSESEDEDPTEKGFLGYIYSRYRLALSRAWTVHRFNDPFLMMEAIKRDDAQRQRMDAHPTVLSDYHLFDTVFGLRSDPSLPRPHALSLGPQYPTGTRVMCNLSKAEYVREDRMTLAWGPRRGVLWYHVLLALISWSSDLEDALSDELARSLHRGRWAGDRICMTVLEYLPDLNHGAAGGDWIDVSGEADELLRDVWAKRLIPDEPQQEFAPYMEWEIRGDRHTE